MKKEIPIHKMVDQAFVKGANALVDEIAEERQFIVSTLKDWINDDEMWKDFVTSKDGRKMFIYAVQELALQEMSTNALIELATIKNEDK